MDTNGTTVAGDSPHPLISTSVDQLDIYIRDCCVKCGFRKTAHKLQLEAAILATATPADQHQAAVQVSIFVAGLLFG
ncbi:hypothetical protein GSI_13204 [Ganoderma sinense ZZ0214-1]|uniref:Uncharacterized protein n=1 Tax=Ganoderma sinense ZZ0214-1 TaxID=1077348 RepID=A0A2G8RUX3_9APHY|nr:hypothetical protein GSI_13204 [Ganoderma sinense ZZ0214-1]